MKQTLEQEVEINHLGEPVIAGTKVTVEAILNKLSIGCFFGDIMNGYGLQTDRPILAAVSYAESLPAQHPLVAKLRQYREHLKQKVKGVLIDLKQCLGVLYGERLVQLVLFGSQARGDAHPGSDIDVLVVLKGPLDLEIEDEHISVAVAELSLRHTETINCILIDEDSFHSSQEPLLRNVRQEGLVV